MYRFVLIIICTVGVSGLYAQTNKKGVGYNGNSVYSSNTPELIDSFGLSWYYNWWIEGENAAETEFVPMIWNDSPNYISANALAIAAGNSSPYLLGFNEPDHEDQANMTVERALEVWPLLMQTNKLLGSPAVAGIAYEDNGWLDRFMLEANARDYRIDFICIHIYQPTHNLDWVLDYCRNTHEKYGLPIWITEWSLVDWTGNNMPSELTQANYLRQVVRALDTIDYVHRHAWFAFYDSGELTTKWDMGLVDDDASITLTGIAMQQSPEHGWHKVDDRHPMVSHDDNWSTYEYPGLGYKGTFTYSEQMNSALTFTWTGTQVRWFGYLRDDLGIVAIYLDNEYITSVDCYAPSLSTDCLLFESEVLNMGNHVLTLVVSGNNNTSSSGFEIICDAFAYREDSILTSTLAPPHQLISMFPNPASTQVRLTQASQWNVIDMHGKLLLSGFGSIIDLRGLKPGNYYVKAGLNTFQLIKIPR